MLAANNTPDFRTIADFRKDHLAALSGLFLQVLELCQRAGVVKLGHVALDGTKVRANASKHKAMSYGRMKEKEAQLQAEVDELLRKAQEVDEEEDRRYGKDRRGYELPEELAFRESRLRKIREAKAALEAEALTEAEQAESEGRNHSGVPDEKAQRNLTDPDSRIMPGPGGTSSSPTTVRCWWRPECPEILRPRWAAQARWWKQASPTTPPGRGTCIARSPWTSRSSLDDRAEIWELACDWRRNLGVHYPRRDFGLSGGSHEINRAHQGTGG